MHSAFLGQLGQGPNNWYQSYSPVLETSQERSRSFRRGSPEDRRSATEEERLMVLEAGGWQASSSHDGHGPRHRASPEQPPQPFDAVLGAHGDPSSSYHGSRQEVPPEPPPQPPIVAEETPFQSWEGKIHQLNDRYDLFLEQLVRERKERESQQSRNVSLPNSWVNQNPSSMNPPNVIGMGSPLTEVNPNPNFMNLPNSMDTMAHYGQNLGYIHPQPFPYTVLTAGSTSIGNVPIGNTSFGNIPSVPVLVQNPMPFLELNSNQHQFYANMRIDHHVSHMGMCSMGLQNTMPNFEPNWKPQQFGAATQFQGFPANPVSSQQTAPYPFTSTPAYFGTQFGTHIGSHHESCVARDDRFTCSLMSEGLSKCRNDYHLRNQHFLHEEAHIPLPGQGLGSSSSVTQGDMMNSRPLSRDEFSASAKDLLYSHHQQQYGLQHLANNSFNLNSSPSGLVNTSSQRCPASSPEKPPQLSDIGLPRMPVSHHYNSFASTFDRAPTSLKFGSSISRRENDTHLGRSDSSLISDHAKEPEHVVILAGSPTNFSKPDDGDEDKRGTSVEHKAGVDEFGEAAADTEVGTDENASPRPVDEKDGSLLLPIDLLDDAAGETEIDQVIQSPGKSKESKDSRPICLFKFALADVVKEEASYLAEIDNKDLRQKSQDNIIQLCALTSHHKNAWEKLVITVWDPGIKSIPTLTLGQGQFEGVSIDMTQF